MYLPKMCSRMLCTLFPILFSIPLAAQDDGQLNWTESKDQWGQVLFCQLIYKMPEVKTRLHSFDVEQHAYRLSHNTSEPYHAVVECREFYRKLTKSQGLHND